MDHSWQATILRGRKILSKTLSKSKGGRPVLFLLPSLISEEQLDDFIDELAHEFDLTLIMLPGHPNNPDNARVSNAVEVAYMIEDFCKAKRIKSFRLIAHSDSTPSAYFYSYIYPSRVSELVLISASPGLRDSVKVLWDQNLNFFDDKNMDRFSNGMMYSVMNFSRRFEINNFNQADSEFHQSLLNLIDNQETNLSMLRQFICLNDLPDGLKVPTLILNGEFDIATGKYDGHLVKKRCLEGTYGIVRQTDHLNILEKPAAMSRFITKFFYKGKSVIGDKDIEIVSEELFPIRKRVIFNRFEVDEIGFVDCGNGVDIPINIVDMTSFGCRMFTIFNRHSTFRNSRLTLKLSRDEWQDDFEIDLLLFSRNRNYLKGVFHYHDIQQNMFVESFLESLKLSGEEEVA